MTPLPLDLETYFLEKLSLAIKKIGWGRLKNKIWDLEKDKDHERLRKTIIKK